MLKPARTLLVACSILAAPLALAQTAAQPAPDVLVKEVTLEVLDIIQKDKEIRAGDQKKVIELIEAKVLPHFNFMGMAALAMGQNWNKANAEQKAVIAEQFKILLLRTYSSAITAYRDQKFEFRPLRAKPTDTDVTVNVRVLQPGAQPVTIDYDMEKTAGGWKVYNVYVAGVSLVLNYRSEFANLIREGGIDGLIRNLRAKNEGPGKPAAKQ